MRLALFGLMAALVLTRPAYNEGEPSLDESLAAMAGASPAPWRDRTTGSAQHQFPLYLGASPRELELGHEGKARAEVPQGLKELGEEWATRVASTTGAKGAIEIEAWPAQDDDGQVGWVFARWRAKRAKTWQWLTTDNWKASWGKKPGERPILPVVRDPRDAKDASILFDDFLDYASPYDQPQQGNCVFVDGKDRIVLGWPEPRDREKNAKRFKKGKQHWAYCLPQPARFNRERIALVITVDETVRWDERIAWAPPPPHELEPERRPLLVREWPRDFAKRYRCDVAIFSGETMSEYPECPQPPQPFLVRGSFQENNDLEAVVDYLETRYEKLGIRTERQRFTWRGIAQSNLVAIVRGRERGGAPVVLADHIDAAVEEDTFDATGQRVTTHGANDNATATALLLRAAEIFKASPPRHDVWLVHLTGEEFPSDGIGCWKFLGEKLAAKQDLRAVLITDFIGYHRPGENMFQINPTADPASIAMAELALDAAAQLAPEWKALYQPRDSNWNGVYNTDVQEFEYLGVPGLLFNQYLNYTVGRKVFDPHNHQSTDTIENIDFDYATALSKVAIETTARLAE